MTTTAWITTVPSYLDTEYCDVMVLDDSVTEPLFHTRTNLKHDDAETPEKIDRVADDLLREAGWQRTQDVHIDEFGEPKHCYCENGCDNWSSVESGSVVTVEKI